jgi:hypothetical protein
MHTHTTTAPQHPYQPPHPCHDTSYISTTSFNCTDQSSQRCQMPRHPAVSMPMITPPVNIPNSVSISTSVLHQSIAHVFIEHLPSLWHGLINTHIVIQCTSMHAVLVDTWCMRTLHAAQSTSACMRSLTPVHLHVLDIINHSISWYLYMSLTMAAASCMHTLQQTHCPQVQELLIIQPSMQYCYHVHERAQILAGRHTITQARYAYMHCYSIYHDLLFQYRVCSEHRPTDSTLDA